MDCREFIEISEAYLSDELLVETNIQVVRHLETCSECRASFASRRRLRQQMLSAVRNSKDFRIDPSFALRLKVELKETALPENAWRFLVVPVFVPLFTAAMLIIGFLGLGALDPSYGRIRVLFSSLVEKPVIEGVAEILTDVVGHHRSCAIQKLKIWEQAVQKDPSTGPPYRDKILKPLRAVSDQVRLLHTDDCIFEGRPYVHVILKDGEKVVSVFFEKTDHISDSTADLGDTIVPEELNGFQIASFRKHSQTVIVVSDFSGVENLTFAQSLLEGWTRI